MIEQIKIEIKNLLEEYYKNNGFEVSIVVETPKDPKLGDISVPMFTVVKVLRKPMPQIVEEALNIIKNADLPIKDVKSVGAYINLFVDKELLSEKIILKCLNDGSNYGNSNMGVGKNVTLDYSSPNIAKSFSIGHLRSTMIGNSIKLILKKCGYNTFAINYLGDWGTQFGKMIVAYKKWGNKEVIMNDPISELTKLYVKFHEEAEKDKSLEDEAREAFRQMLL